jgi:YgiT-type zinc finger domain-containing protein
MKCTICKNGDTAPGETVVTLTKNEFVIVFKNVPAEVCQNCGEGYVSQEISRALLTSANESFHKGSLVDVREYKAA